MNSPDDSSTVTLMDGSAQGRVLKPGEVLGGSYMLKSLIGQGGMGFVYLAQHVVMGKDYALKIMSPDCVTPSNWERFETEGRAIARMDHPNIVRVHNMGIDNGNCPYYVMDLLTGMDLSNYKKAELGFTLEDILSILKQVTLALGYAHRKGIIHLKESLSLRL